MRMWMVDPEILCQKHLIGEHGELHKFRHNFVKQHRMDGRRGQIEPESMKKRHDELAAEMLRRGYKHNSPYEQPDISHLQDFPPVDVEGSLKLLIERCPKCRKRKDMRDVN